MALITTRLFYFQAQTEMVEEWWNECLYCHLYFPQNNHFFTLKYKSDIVFSVSRSLDQNFMKLEKRS